jgi:hypothetical protein
MAFSKIYSRTMSLLTRTPGRLAGRERARAQEAAYLASAQQRLEESCRLAAVLRQQAPMGPRRAQQTASGAAKTQADTVEESAAIVPSAGR